jgi:glycosidase
MTNLRLPFASALDPLPHKFKLVPRPLLDALGLTINRDEVRTPMQWDMTNQAGFSSARMSWLPVHPNHLQVNVAHQIGDPASLLNTVRALLNLRKQHAALREGSLRLLDGLPAGVLGFVREVEDEEVMVLLNFEENEKDFPAPSGETLFCVSTLDEVRGGHVHLTGRGGLIVKINKPGLDETVAS